MRNLAGDPDCDREIERELTRCRIPVVRGERSAGEVSASITGKLGPFTFRRAWYYWVVNGPMPIETARTLYADPLGKADVRVGGHCGCPSPDDYGAMFFDADGLYLIVDPDGEEERRAKSLAESLDSIRDELPKWRFVASKEERARLGVRAIVDCYHVDSEAGLRLIADAIASLESARAELQKKDG